MPTSLSTVLLALGGLLIAAGAEIAGCVVAGVAVVWEVVVSLIEK